MAVTNLSANNPESANDQNTSTLQWQQPDPERLARQFSRLGWIGFWIQLVLIAVPIFLLFYVLVANSPEAVQRRGLDLRNYLSYGSLVVMLFTTVWFYRYTRLAKRIADPALCPPQSAVVKTVWIGLWASCLGIFFSMILMINAVGRILFVLLTIPQTGIPFAAVGADPAKTLSAIDAVSLVSLVMILTAELIVMAFSIWFLFRLTRPSAEMAVGASSA
ncbi:MAG TPA: DUF3611 family protein [Desulfobacterales bacterium]